MNKNIHTFLGMESEYAQASMVVFGVPFDGTTSYRPGTRFAPQVMRAEFVGLETYSPLLDKDLEDFLIFDGGDLELPFGNVKAALNTIKAYTQKVLADHKKPLMIGGEHLVSLPTIQAVYEKYPDLRVIHLDAHTDLREHYLDQPLSHASVMRRVWDFLGDDKIFQFGIRSGTKAEFDFAKAGHTHLTRFDLSGLVEVLEEIKKYPLYITIDLDVLDPSIFAGTGTPEAGGITYKALEQFFLNLQNVNIVAADVVELSPHYDASGVSTAVACKVLREMALLMV